LSRPVQPRRLRDVTRCKQAEKRQELLSDELDHRVKNVLARVAAVVRYTRRRSGNPDEFVRAIEGRIQSIAAAHALLSESRWSGVGLTDLTSSRPTPPMQILRFSGPDVMLLVNDREQASAALAFDMLPLYSTKLRYKSWMIT
jgi:light-regulated signal transduction histidine kinase (bacteriophytochrome)